MKKIIPFLLILVGCSTTAPVQPPQDSYLIYSFAGNTVRHEGSISSFSSSGNGAFISKTLFPQTTYTMFGYSGPNSAIRILIACDSLINTLPGESIIVFQGKNFSGSITSSFNYSGGVVSGSFSGKYFNLLNKNDSINVVGQFNKIQVIY